MRLLAGAAALLVLNAALSFSALWPTPFVVPDARIAPEFVGLWVVVLLAALTRWGTRRGWLALLSLAYLALVLGRYADVTVPSLFGRPINVYWDLPQLPRFLWVSAQAWPAWQTAATVAGAVAALAAMYAVLRACIGELARHVAPAARRRGWAWGLTGAAVALAAANYAGVQATWPYVSKPVVPVAWRQAQVLAGAFSSARQATVLPPSSPVDAALAARGAAPLAGLHGADVYLMPLESLGAVTYDDPALRAALAPARAGFEAGVRAAGYRVLSGFLRAPTFAGGTELSHLSLLSGIDLADPMRHDVLLTTQRPTLVTLFRAQGYDTYGVYPGVFWEWPERAFYRFDVFVDGPALDWRGPEIGYWKIPDQFSMARFESRHPRTAAAPPRFVFFPTITCHLPFSPVPPFQPDWARLLGDDPFDAADVRATLAEQADWTDMRPGYLRMVDYTYRWLGAFLRRGVPRDTVYVFVGDHQPAASVTGEGASWDVPVHIVARDERLLQRFAALGYREGMAPPRAPLGGLHDLTSQLLQAFSSAPSLDEAQGRSLPPRLFSRDDRTSNRPAQPAAGQPVRVETRQPVVADARAGGAHLDARPVGDRDTGRTGPL